MNTNQKNNVHWPGKILIFEGYQPGMDMLVVGEWYNTGTYRWLGWFLIWLMTKFMVDISLDVAMYTQI